MCPFSVSFSSSANVCLYLSMFLSVSLSVSLFAPQMTPWCHVLTLPEDGRIGISRLCSSFGNSLPSDLRSLRETCSLALFVNCSRLSYLTEPGPGAPLNSHREGAPHLLYSLDRHLLYRWTFVRLIIIDRQIIWQTCNLIITAYIICIRIQSTQDAP